MFHQKIRRYIEEKHLFSPFDGVLVALSGGADSVALLRVLLALGYRCEAAHGNFQLRGEESDRDEQFVRALCNHLNVLLHTIHFDTSAYADAHRISIEMAARELRYDWFEQLRKERGLNVVAVGHHRDDNVETFLLNLVRGTGINGLTGIRPRNGFVVRPLLEVGHKDILQYLQEIQQEYVTDSTNLQDEYKRNQIRLDILPLLNRLNPSVSESIAETAARLADVARIYNKEMEAGKRRVLAQGSDRIHIPTLLSEMVPHALLFEILHPLGFHPLQVRDVWRSLFVAQPGKRFVSADWEVLRDRDFILIRRNKRKDACIPKTVMNLVKRTPDFVIPKECSVACFDAEKLVLPLTMRKWQKGDRFVPFGMKGTKKVSDYLTDRKFSGFQKENQYVMCSQDKIVWVVGERSDNRFRVTEKTEWVLVVRLQKDNEV